MWYIGIIAFANLSIIAAHLVFSELPYWQSVILPPTATFSVIAVDAIGAFVGRHLPVRFFTADKTLPVGDRERRFYKKIGIKKWKDKVPELGGFTGFHKSQLENPNDKEYLGRFLLESNYGIICHIINITTGFLIIAIPFCGPLTVTLSVAFVNAVLNFLPIAVLRYNNAVLLRAYKRAK